MINFLFQNVFADEMTHVSTLLSVSVRTLTVLAIKVISVKRLLGFINYTAFKEIN